MVSVIPKNKTNKQGKKSGNRNVTPNAIRKKPDKKSIWLKPLKTPLYRFETIKDPIIPPTDSKDVKTI